MNQAEICVMLDSLLDTRIGTINKHRPDLTSKILKSKYHRRKSDFFDGITREDYLRWYADRDEETLANSVVTNVIDFARLQLSDLAKETTLNDADIEPMLTINVYPYQLSEQTKEDIRESARERMKGMFDVKIIDMSLEEMTPAYCYEHFFMTLIYDYPEWINYHLKSLTETPHHRLIVVGPAIFFNTNPETNPEAMEELRRGNNPLEILVATLATRICLRLIDVEIFSVIYPDNRILGVGLQPLPVENNPAPNP